MAVTVAGTVVDVVRNPDGSKTVQSFLTLTGTYDATAGVVLTPAMFGLTAFKALKNGLGFIDPVVLQASDAAGKLGNYIAMVSGQVLRLIYPSGGGAAAPTTPAQPAATTTPAVGATAVTSTGAQPAMAAVITPGLGKEFPTGATVTNFSMAVEAVGY